VTTADQWIARCANLRRAPEETSKRREAVCIREAHEKVEPLYVAASASARGQRGTTMYLDRYHAEWNAAMTALGQSGPTSEQESSAEEQRKALHDIAAKLIND
jgi:hypothetical protein